MEILHVIRSQDDLSESVQAILDDERPEYRSRILFLQDRAADPDNFDRELFDALQRADRVISW